MTPREKLGVIKFVLIKMNKKSKYNISFKLYSPRVWKNCEAFCLCGCFVCLFFSLFACVVLVCSCPGDFLPQRKDESVLRGIFDATAA